MKEKKDFIWSYELNNLYVSPSQSWSLYCYAFHMEMINDLAMLWFMSCIDKVLDIMNYFVYP